MRINIRGGREIAVSQPLLNHLHRDTVCQKQAGARVAQIVKADAPQMIIPQDDLERIGEIIRLEQIAHCIYADSDILLSRSSRGESLIFALII